jgi:hypothetical protein
MSTDANPAAVPAAASPAAVVTDVQAAPPAEPEPVPAAAAPAPRRWRRYRNLCLWCVATVALAYVLSAYVFLPMAWSHAVARHPGLNEAVPRQTKTGAGIPGDPLNIGLIGTEQEVLKLFAAAGWRTADPINAKTTLRLTRTTLLGKPYDTAPVSNLFLWGRKQDLAFQHPFGKTPKKRHHVRFWRSEDLDEDGRPLWIGGATFDRSVGFSHTTGQITHHIDGNVDAERNKLLKDLEKTGQLATIYWEKDFHQRLEGHNGGGDAWRTDGRLAVGVIGTPEEDG